MAANGRDIATSSDFSVLVTGAGNGIGAALVRALLADGARVAAFDRDEDGLGRLGDAPDGRLLRDAFDITDHGRLERACAAVATWADGLDAVVHCAGYGPYRPFLDYDRAAWDTMLAVNLTAYADLVRLLLPGMITRGRGHLVAIGSERGETQAPGTSIYAATKAGLAAFSRALAMDYGSRGIHVCVVAPGGVLTDFGAQRAHEKDARFLDAEDVASSICFMLRHRGRAWVRDLTLLPLGV